MNTERENYDAAAWQICSEDSRRLKLEQMTVPSFATEVNTILVNRNTALRHMK